MQAIGVLMPIGEIGFDWEERKNLEVHYKHFRSQIGGHKLNQKIVLLAALETINRNYPGMKDQIRNLFIQNRDLYIKLHRIWPNQNENEYIPSISDLDALYEYLDQIFDIQDDIAKLLMVLRIGMIEFKLLGDQKFKIKEVTNYQNFITVLSFNQYFRILYLEKNVQLSIDRVRSLVPVGNNNPCIVLGCTHKFPATREQLSSLLNSRMCAEASCGHTLYQIERNIIESLLRKHFSN